MQVIDYFESDRQQHWLQELKKSDWGAGRLLCKMIEEETFFKELGAGKLLMLTDGDALISYCTYAEWDDIQPTELTPWMGFVYTFPAHRGHRYVGLLFAEIERLAKAQGVAAVYISTPHVGLYEKYGCTFYGVMTDITGKPSRIYQKKL